MTAAKDLNEAGGVTNARAKVLRAVDPKIDPRDAWLDRTPEPLDRRAELPAFPSDVFPAWIGDFVEALATSTQTPSDMPGTFALGALAAALGGRLRVEINSGYVEGVNLYAGIVAEPGTRKSPVHAACTQPIAEVERELRADAAPEIVRLATRKAIFEGRAKKAAADAEAAKGADAGRLTLAAEEAAHEAAAIKVPRDPLLLVGDATPERLVEMLGEHGGRLAIIADEDPIFGQLRGRYSKAPLLDPLLSAYSGATIRRHRKDRVDVVIEHPALTIVVAIQPRVLEGIPADHEIRTRGLLDRFAIVVPKNLIGYRDMDPPTMPVDIAEAYSERLRALTLESYRGKTRTLRMSAEARAALVAWLRVLERKKRPAGAYAPIVGWASKAEGLTSRIAALMHAASGKASNEIGADSIERATVVVSYFAAHALVAADAMGADAALNDARKVLAWVRDFGGSFTQRDIARNLTSLPEKEREAAIGRLTASGYLYETTVRPTAGTRGGRPSKRWELHPNSSSEGVVSAVLSVSAKARTGGEEGREREVSDTDLLTTPKPPKPPLSTTDHEDGGSTERAFV